MNRFDNEDKIISQFQKVNDNEVVFAVADKTGRFEDFSGNLGFIKKRARGNGNDIVISGEQIAFGQIILHFCTSEQNLAERFACVLYLN